MTKKQATSHVQFETSLNALETIIGKIEQGQLSLEEALKSFEEGVSLSRQCQEALKAAEQKVQILMEQNGVLQSEPFLVEES